MQMVCGTCRQFIRNKQSQSDLCSAWDNPTTMKRQACQFWMPKSSFSLVKNEEKQS
ncbi:hypothetical protein [Vibrio hippocampi]|uniref:DUF1289 domain-containing protein n=1 Tax=Vibrio hippocampi TaxID=654686 RepID=A0ABM8ZLF0_9VIBR|nr:hypothetical protein [Vibrio hippocampi]CAH0528929.1 hypothetical protein VHP8226_02959 [Vibrio hippocampi]